MGAFQAIAFDAEQRNPRELGGQLFSERRQDIADRGPGKRIERTEQAIEDARALRGGRVGVAVVGRSWRVSSSRIVARYCSGSRSRAWTRAALVLKSVVTALSFASAACAAVRRARGDFRLALIRNGGFEIGGGALSVLANRVDLRAKRLKFALRRRASRASLSRAAIASALADSSFLIEALTSASCFWAACDCFCSV